MVWVEKETLWAKMGTSGLASISNCAFWTLSTLFTYRNIVIKRERENALKFFQIIYFKMLPI